MMRADAESYAQISQPKHRVKTSMCCALCDHWSVLPEGCGVPKLDRSHS